MSIRRKTRLASNRHSKITFTAHRGETGKLYKKKLGLELLEDRRLLSVALFTNSSLMTSGLVGSYVNKSLQTYSAQDDWRTSQLISGTRVDANLNFTTATWGTRSTVGVTGGSNSDWENFSVQWDGYLQVPQSGTRIATTSDDGSRLWIDTDRDGVFESGELLDNGWGNIQGATTGQRSPALAAGTYPIRIQYYENSGGNDFSLAEASYIPTQFVATPTTPKQTVRVLVLNYDPPVPAMQNKLVHQVFGWTDPHRLATDLEGDMEWASGGAVDLQVVSWRDVPEFPAFTDNYRYTPEEYVSYWQTQTGSHAGSTNFYRLVEEQGLAALINSHAVDEVWCFGPPGVDLFGESWMFGPNSYYINGPTFPEVGIDRAVAGHSFNYERGPDCTIHDIGHRMENVGSRAYGSTWNLANPTSAWDLFTANYWQSPAGAYGIGSCHVPANGEAHYDYANTLVVQSTANDWLNYPNLTGATSPVSCDIWAFGPNPDYGRDYLNWFFGLVPRANGTTADGRQNNWYKYLYDFNAYEPTTGLPRNEDAFVGAATVKSSGATSYDFTVTYYDQTAINTATIDSNDVRVTGPGGYNVAAVHVGTDIQRNTTAGTTLTVTYRITPPGGSWNLADNGTYQIAMQSNQVRDTSNHAVPAGNIGYFRVAVSDPSLLDINAIVAAGGAAITHTTFDIGTESSIFDGNFSSLARSANINPAFIQVAFTAPQTIRGFNAVFTANTTQWQIETADTQADLDGKTGTYHLAVSWTIAASDQLSPVTLTTPATARLFKFTAQRLAGDNYVHICEWQMLGSAVSPESNPPDPSATLTDVTAVGGTSYFVNVTYADATSVDMTSVATGDIIVTGPNGFSVVPSFYDSSDFTNGTSRMATYWFIPPGGYWDPADNGSYMVSLQPNKVRDIFGNAASQAVAIGTFQVNSPLPVRHPAADLTELDAVQWTAWADGAIASVADDSSRKTTGSASVRFETTGGFDTYLRFPPQYAADWDLTYATNLHFSVYALNTNTPGFQNNSPWIRLYDSSGSYADYRYYDSSGNPADILNNARNQWQSYTVLLNASQTTLNGWRRYSTGTLHLNHIVSIEFHADTWGGGFTLWYDNVGFNLPTNTVYAWDGGGGNNLWSTGANWDHDVAPSSGDNLVFPAGTARMNTINDYPLGTAFGSIVVSGGNYSFQNNPLQSTTVAVQEKAVLTVSSIVCDTLTIGSHAIAATNTITTNITNFAAPSSISVPQSAGSDFSASSTVGCTAIPPRSFNSPGVVAQPLIDQVYTTNILTTYTAPTPLPLAVEAPQIIAPSALPVFGQTISIPEIVSIAPLPEQTKQQTILAQPLHQSPSALRYNADLYLAARFDNRPTHAFAIAFRMTDRLNDSADGELTDFLEKAGKQSAIMLTEDRNAPTLALQSLLTEFQRDLEVDRKDPGSLIGKHARNQEKLVHKAVDDFHSRLVAWD